jgi:hypothetical protein
MDGLGGSCCGTRDAMKKIITISCAVIVVWALGGCQGGEDSQDNPEGDPAIASAASTSLHRNGDDIILTTYGSGNCPFVISKVEQIDAATVRIELDIPRAQRCTTDMKKHEAIVQPPPGATPDDWTAAVVVKPQREPRRIEIT